LASDPDRTRWNQKSVNTGQLALEYGSWLSEPNGGDQLAHALLAAACTTEVTAEHAYLALITPPEKPDDQSA
jgi:hypothetical protein